MGPPREDERTAPQAEREAARAHVNRALGLAWLGLSLALALHVLDEALTGFLDFYNPLVESLRESYPLLPFPVFSFEGWLGSLIAGVVTLLALSRWAFAGANWIAWLAWPYAILMLGNGLGHLLGSLAFGRWLPGVASAPLLLAASLYLLAQARRMRAVRRS